uniref:Aminoalcoholphosphotransferase n=1 Tax=Cucumis sativus TaxID=3659 RepID=A0A0A0KTQ1_CUCSA
MDAVYSPHLDSAPPRWVHFAHGLLLFLYQTFDAVDGKQARRTNSSSPLGELFDHGCDALACAFETLAFGSTAMCGRSSFWFWVLSAVPFYGATWEHFFTNTLVLPVVNGPTEGLMLIYLCHFFTTFVGAGWWTQQFGKSIPIFSWVPIFHGKTSNLLSMKIFYIV